jgi:hypothetical protein
MRLALRQWLRASPPGAPLQRNRRGQASEIAKATQLTRQTVLRIKTDPAKAEAALAAWGM